MYFIIKFIIKTIAIIVAAFLALAIGVGISKLFGVDGLNPIGKGAATGIAISLFLAIWQYDLDRIFKST